MYTGISGVLPPHQAAHLIFSKAIPLLQHVSRISAVVSVLQCVAVCCSVVQCVAVRCRVVQCGAGWCSVLRCVVAWCGVVQSVASCLSH